MKLIKRMILIASLVVALVAFTSMEAFALTTDEVQAQVNAQGKEAVTGNILVWFLCAVAFLKVSQKIDSFMSSLGIHVGNTGGSMLAEMMIAARGFQMMSHGGGHRGGGGGSAGGSGSGSGGSRFLQNGVGGAIGRSIQRGATKNANGTKSGGVGGAIYHSSVAKGGGFANRVIGNIAHGSIGSTGTISSCYPMDAVQGLVFGSSMELAYRILSEEGGRQYFLLDRNYDHFYFLTSDHYGERLLQLLCDRTLRERLESILLDDLYEADTGSTLENDAFDEADDPVLLGYFCDLQRIQRFDTGLQLQNRTGTIICFDFQKEALSRYCCDRVRFQVIDFQKWERSFFA